MPLRIKCSSGHTLIVPDDRAGRRLRCPRCQAEVVVPGEAAAVAATASVAVAAEEPVRTSSAPGSASLPISDRTESPIAAPPISEKRREPSRPASRAVVKPKSRALPVPPPESPQVPPIVPASVEKPATAAAVPSPKPAQSGTVASPPAPKAPAPPRAPVTPPRSQPLEPATPAKSPPPPPIVRPAPAVLLKVPDVAPPQVTVPPESREAAVGPAKTASLPTATASPPPPPTLSAAIPLPPPTEPTSPLVEPAVVSDEKLPAVAEVAPIVPAVEHPEPEPPVAVSPALAEPAEEEGLFDHLAALDFAPPTAAIRPVAADANPEGARTLAVYQLAAALVAAALFSVAPAVWDLVEYLRIDGSPFVARWALLLFFIGVLQLAYAVYLFQLPDWSSVWVITVFALCGAALYAGVLGIVLMSAPDGVLVGPHGLQLADKLAGGKAALWCVAMVALLVMLALAAGKLCLSWQRAERMLIAARGGV